MLKVENLEVTGWEAAIRGMRNPKNSWNKSDTMIVDVPDTPRLDYSGNVVEVIPAHKQVVMRYEDENWNGIGANDLDLMKKLVKAGTDHSKFMRMINVTMDITAPIYWISEHDTYKVGTTRNSCSFMHRGVSKEFSIEDFSFNSNNEKLLIETIIPYLNDLRSTYLETKDEAVFESIRQLLPSGYNQRYTWQANYQVCRNIYKSRCNHRLKEWKDFCESLRNLPYSELITM